MTKISKKLNNIIFILFILFILANQFAIYLSYKFISYLFLGLMFSLICISYYRDKNQIYKKFINFQNIIFFSIFLLLIYFYYQNGNSLNLKISLYIATILLISNLTYQKNDLELILNITLLLASLLLIIGFFGWFHGGEQGAWGNQFIYFGYRYLPSTRNQDGQIFFLSYIISLFFIFSKKKGRTYFILNSLFAVALFLSYSRGLWLIYAIIFLFILLMSVFFQYIEAKKLFKIYLLNIFFIVTTICIFNPLIKKSYPNSQLTLQNQFYIKIISIYKFIKIKNDKIDINNNSISHLEATSIESWHQKLNEYLSVKSEIPKINYFAIKDNYKYYENSLLFFLLNIPAIFLLYLIYFFSEFYFLVNFIFKNKRWHNKINFTYIIFLSCFIYLNSIFNLTQDSMTYLYFLLIIIFKKLLLDNSILRNSL
jgi:hypothetical protein